MITCWSCSRENRDGELICIYCGAPLSEVKEPSTRSLGDTDYEDGKPKWGSARFNTDMNLIVEVLETRDSFIFDADQIEELVIGRRNPDNGEAPNIDLSHNKAQEKGVSRRHARIIRRDGGALHIVDNDSANGTYLNGQRLIANQPRVLRDGDDIRLGHLVVRITFRPR